MVVAYLRVSTSKQNLDDQQEEVVRFARKRGLQIDKWFGDVASGKIEYNERKLCAIIDSLHAGDTLIVTEISRLSRTLVEIMNIINRCVTKNIILHCTKEGYTFEDNLNSKILGFAFGLVAEIERNLISIRTKEALAAKKAKGTVLGRPHGSSPQQNILFENRLTIIKLIEEGIPYKKIAEKYNVSICTFHRFVKANIKKKDITENPFM